MCSCVCMCVGVCVSMCVGRCVCYFYLLCVLLLCVSYAVVPISWCNLRCVFVCVHD